MSPNNSSRCALTLLILLVSSACSTPARTHLELGTARASANGALAYQATLVGTRVLVSTELRTRFELVIRRLDGRHAVELGRLDLGPPDWDTTGLVSATTGPVVWLGSRDGTVRAINIETMSEIKRWPVGSAVTSIAIDPGGALLAYGTSNGIVCLRRVSDGALLQCVHHSKDEITAMTWGRDRLATATSSGGVTQFRLPSLAIETTAQLDASVAALSFGRGEVLVAALGERPGRSIVGRGSIAILSTDSTARCEGHADSVTSIAWTANQTQLVSGSLDGTVRIWEVDQTARNGCRLLATRTFGQPVTFLVNPPGREGHDAAVAYIGMWATERDQQTAVLVDYLYPPR